MGYVSFHAREEDEERKRDRERRRDKLKDIRGWTAFVNSSFKIAFYT